MSPSVCHKPLLYRNDWTAWASAHRGKWGQLTPLENGWKIKKRKHAKKEVFWIFWEQSGQAGVDHLCWPHIYSDILQNAPFHGQIFKIFFASGGKTAGRFSCFFVTEVSFHSVFKEIWLCPKIMVHPSGTSSLNSRLRKFCDGKSIALSNKTRHRRWLSLLTTPVRQVVSVYYKSVNCNPPTPLLQLVVDFL